MLVSELYYFHLNIITIKALYLNVKICFLGILQSRSKDNVRGKLRFARLVVVTDCSACGIILFYYLLLNMKLEIISVVGKQRKRYIISRWGLQ